MMYGPHVSLHDHWSPLTQRAEKEPAGPLGGINYTEKPEDVN
jgi:hypothetical protein